MSRSKTDEVRVAVQTYLPPDVAKALEARARDADRSVAGEMRVAIREYLAKPQDEQ